MERRSNHTTTHSFSPHSLHIRISDRSQLLLKILHCFLLRLHFTQRFLVCLFEIRNFGFGSVYFLLQSIDFTYKAKDTHTCDPNRLGSFPILSEIVVGDYNIARNKIHFQIFPPGPQSVEAYYILHLLLPEPYFPASSAESAFQVPFYDLIHQCESTYMMESFSLSSSCVRMPSIQFLTSSSNRYSVSTFSNCCVRIQSMR